MTQGPRTPSFKGTITNVSQLAGRGWAVCIEKYEGIIRLGDAITVEGVPSGIWASRVLGIALGTHRIDGLLDLLVEEIENVSAEDIVGARLVVL